MDWEGILVSQKKRPMGHNAHLNDPAHAQFQDLSLWNKYTDNSCTYLLILLNSIALLTKQSIQNFYKTFISTYWPPSGHGLKKLESSPVLANSSALSICKYCTLVVLVEEIFKEFTFVCKSLKLFLWKLWFSANSKNQFYKL